MRLRLLATSVVLLTILDQGVLAGQEASWTGSIGRVVASGHDPDDFQFMYLDGARSTHGRMLAAEPGTAPVETAIRLETLIQPPRMESLQARLAISEDVDAGAGCWLHFTARAERPQVELGLGRLSISVRPTAPNSEPFLSRMIYLKSDWTPVDLPFPMPAAFDAGDAEIAFAVGTQLQSIEIGDVAMRCFEDDAILARLPQSTFSYAGREQDASWRAVAQSQIERYRQGDLTVEVTGIDGQPVADAEIHIKMSRHAFEFGVAVDEAALAGVAADAGDDAVDEQRTASYRKNLKDLFNSVTFGRALSWPAWTSPSQRRTTEEALAWVESLGLSLRGRGLVPTKIAALPEALQGQRDDAEALREAIRASVTKTVGDLADHVGGWDVVDQPRLQHDLLDLLGRGEMATWFQLARNAAPDVKLGLAESGILAGDRMAELATLIGRFIDLDVPIDRIGMLAQFGAQPPPIQVLSDRLDQLASFDLPLTITAFDMITADRQLQRDFARDFLTLVFSHPSVEGFVFGRYWQDQDASPGMAIYNVDGTISAVGEVYRDLVLRAWWTDLVALSNVEGMLTSRVFQGDYVVSARKEELRASATLTVGPDGRKVTLRLAASGDDSGEPAL